MNYKIHIGFIALTLLIGCYQDPFLNGEGPLVDSRMKKMNDFMRGVMSVGYTEDFPVSRRNPKRVDRKPTTEEIKLILIASKRDINYLRDQYPHIRRQLIIWSEKNKAGEYTMLMQSIILRYLRNLFLKDDGIDAVEEIKFLMDIIIPTEPVDLDVIADAFDRIRAELPAGKINSYTHYIVSIYMDQSNQIKSKTKELQEKFALAGENEADKHLAIMEGKYIERLSKSCQHTKEKLNLVIN